MTVSPGSRRSGAIRRRTGGAPPRCESPEPITALAAPPRDPGKANQVRVAVNAGGYQTVTADEILAARAQIEAARRGVAP